jgi:hypothetical protein
MIPGISETSMNRTSGRFSETFRKRKGVQRTYIEKEVRKANLSLSNLAFLGRVLVDPRSIGRNGSARVVVYHHRLDNRATKIFNGSKSREKLRKRHTGSSVKGMTPSMTGSLTGVIAASGESASSTMALDLIIRPGRLSCKVTERDSKLERGK